MEHSDKIILLELNELCPELMAQYMGQAELPNFQRFYESSQVYTTTVDVEDPSKLEPWIQWYSIHTGLSFENHKVFNLTDGPAAKHRDLWDVLRENGRTVANFSSMNCKGFDGDGNVFLPDPWCTSESPHPRELNSFYDVVARQVQEYTNRESRLGMQEYTSFLWFLVRRGLSFETIATILRQLADEKTAKRDVGWKRVSLLDRLLFDVARYYWLKYKPDFCTFFLNSVAHYQHAYWRQMAPEQFQVKPTPEEIETYGGAILFGYRQMDRILGKFVELEKHGATLVLATALSQQPFLKYEATGGQRFYRPQNIDNLFKQLEIRPTGAYPVMTHQYNAEFSTVEQAQSARAVLEKVTYAGEPVFAFNEDAEPRHVFFYCNVREKAPDDASIRLGNGRKIPFSEVFYMIDASKSGCHHPDGALWFKSGCHNVHEEKVSILDIFPTLLRMHGIEPPEDTEGRVLEDIVPCKPVGV